MPAQFMNAKQTAEYLNMSITWVYRDAPKGYPVTVGSPVPVPR